MVLILSHVSFEKLVLKPDIKKYALDSDFFSFKYVESKPEAALQAAHWVNWYSIFSTTPLYVSVITNKYWSMVCGNLEKSYKLSVWKTVPRYIEEALKENSPYHIIEESARICNEEKLLGLSKEIKKHNYRNEPVFCKKIERVLK